MKVGDYVRTYHNGIGKILEIDELNDLIKIGKEKWIIPNDIIKKNNEIINLIEVGDYVNGERVFGFGKFKYDDGTEEITSLTLDKTILCLPEDIKSIVTKEQFESMEYKVGD